MAFCCNYEGENGVGFSSVLISSCRPQQATIGKTIVIGHQHYNNVASVINGLGLLTALITLDKELVLAGDFNDFPLEARKTLRDNHISNMGDLLANSSMSNNQLKRLINSFNEKYSKVTLIILTNIYRLRLDVSIRLVGVCCRLSYKCHIVINHKDVEVEDLLKKTEKKVESKDSLKTAKLIKN
jgi:hypothetical protein